MWFGAREPLLHIMCLYPGFVCTAAVAAGRLKLYENCESCAVALLVVLLTFRTTSWA